MDVTTIQCGKDTRMKLKEYKEANDFANYDEALRSLMQRVQE
jgi:hypothetical protein